MWEDQGRVVRSEDLAYLLETTMEGQQQVRVLSINVRMSGKVGNS